MEQMKISIDKITVHGRRVHAVATVLAADATIRMVVRFVYSRALDIDRLEVQAYDEVLRYLDIT